MNVWAMLWDKSQAWRALNCEDGRRWRRFVDGLFAKLDAGCECCTRTRVMLAALAVGFVLGYWIG